MTTSLTRMRTPLVRIGLLLLSAATVGCGSSGYRMVQPTELHRETVEVPESELLDVGVALTVAPELSESRMEDQGTNEDIRRSESVFIPFHLKNTLQASSYWGAVQVVPAAEQNVDLKVMSELVCSNGEIMLFEVTAVDASGRVWLDRKYKARVTDADFEGTAAGEHEVFQDLYNTIANDLSAVERSIPPDELERIRMVSEIRFAREFAPDAFGDYLSRDEQGHLAVDHLPAEGDPLMDRIEQIREREHMLVDTLNQYYEAFYMQMWEAYENWRRFSLAEREAMRELEQQAMLRTLGGLLMIASGIAIELDDSDSTDGLGDVLVIGGTQVFASGLEISQQTEIHAAAIEELGESFGSEMRPTVVELEGKQYELTGTAEEQYRHWKDLVRRIYFEETGFDADVATLDTGDPLPQ
ncbi:MAG: hypothetical protein ACYTG1_05430 [Planctomycetota bacterium]|jgi:hypothetical protein